jgi:uncharacterized protein
MLRILFLILLIYIIYRLVKGLFPKKVRPTESRFGGVIDEMVQDPYCKKYIPSREAVHRVLGGQEILFCSEECADKFEAQIEGKQKE